MSVNALSSHHTVVAVQLIPGGVWTDIAEQGDITIPGRSRTESDSSTQLENIDSYVVSGLMRRSPLKVALNFIPSNATQDHLTGLQKLFNANTMTGWKSTYPDGTYIISSGQIQAIGDISAPVDGKLSVDYTIRFSGVYNYNGTTLGA
jgi:hypothetical protein